MVERGAVRAQRDGRVGTREGGEREQAGSVLIVMHRRSRVTIDHRILTMPRGGGGGGGAGREREQEMERGKNGERNESMFTDVSFLVTMPSVPLGCIYFKLAPTGEPFVLCWAIDFKISTAGGPFVFYSRHESFTAVSFFNTGTKFVPISVYGTYDVQVGSVRQS